MTKRVLEKVDWLLVNKSKMDPSMVIKNLINRDITMADLFAGWAGTSQKFNKDGYKARAFDRNTIPEQDFCEDDGLAIAVWYVLRIKPAGFFQAGPQCSTWITMALNHTQRHSEVWGIHGDTRRDDVQEGNTCAAHMALLIRIASSREVRVRRVRRIEISFSISLCLGLGSITRRLT